MAIAMTCANLPISGISMTEVFAETEDTTNENEEIPFQNPKPSIQPSKTPSSAPEFMLGDVTGDKKVTLADAQMALRAALHLVSLNDDPKKAADVDGNSKIELKDAQKILRVALHLDTFNKENNNPSENEGTFDKTAHGGYYVLVL